MYGVADVGASCAGAGLSCPRLSRACPLQIDDAPTRAARAACGSPGGRCVCSRDVAASVRDLACVQLYSGFGNNTVALAPFFREVRRWRALILPEFSPNPNPPKALALAQVLSVEINRHLASLASHNARVCGCHDRVTVLRATSESVCQVGWRRVCVRWAGVGCVRWAGVGCVCFLSTVMLALSTADDRRGQRARLPTHLVVNGGAQAEAKARCTRPQAAEHGGGSVRMCAVRRCHRHAE